MVHEELNWPAHDGLDLYARCWAPDEPRGVVGLVHGLGEHSGRYAHVAAALNRAGYAVLAFDLRGHGRSAGPRGHTPSYEALMADIDLLLEQIGQRFPGRPTFLYGHSLGGNLVLDYALRRRPALAGIVATSPSLRLAFEPPPIQVALGRAMNAILPAFVQPNGLEVAALSRDPQVVHDYTHDPLVHDRISARLFVSIIESGKRALAHAAEMALPLLLVHGDADRICAVEGSREFAAQVPGDCTLQVWEGLYHETHNEPEQEQVLQFTIDWLEAHLPA